MALPLTAPTGVAAAYRAAQAAPGAGPATGADGGFSAMLMRAAEGAVDAGHTADQASLAAMSGNGNGADVVLAVSKAEMALQTAVVVRDRVIAAYQDIMRMPV